MKKKLSLAGRRPVSPSPGVRAAGWLGQKVLLTIHAGDPDGELPVVLLGHADGRLTRCQAKGFVGLGPGPYDPLVLSVFALPQRQARTVGVQFPSRAGRPAAPIEIEMISEDLKALLRRHLAPLSAEVRQAVLATLMAAIPEHDGRGGSELAGNLALVREALRPRLPEVQIVSDVHRGIHVEHLFGLDDHSFYIRGWASVASGSWARLTAVSPEGVRVELAERAFWHRRPDIDKFYGLPPEEAMEAKPGFLCYFELPSRSTLRDGWILEAVDGTGEAVEARAPKICAEIGEVRQSLIADLRHERLPEQEFRVRQVLPAITRLQERHQRALKIDRVLQFGRPPSTPEVSVIIPLYRRVDFLEHQLAQFVHDPELRKADLVYVLDSPELADGLCDRAAGLAELYRVPFRLAILRSNAGYAGANNLGASLARGRRLLLLNSDILPDQPGWLGRLTRFHDAKPKAGAVGVKMLFEDDTLQHAGLYFRRSPGSGLWENQHYFKGLDRRLPAANVTRPVPSLCGACLMIDRALFQEFGGLRGLYVQGDYEDSDLCLRLREAGREIWYLPEVELYHLEGQSYASEDRARNLALNRWLHTHFWDRQIEAMMQRPDFFGQQNHE